MLRRRPQGGDSQTVQEYVDGLVVQARRQFTAAEAVRNHYSHLIAPILGALASQAYSLGLRRAIHAIRPPVGIFDHFRTISISTENGALKGVETQHYGWELDNVVRPVAPPPHANGTRILLLDSVEFASWGEYPTASPPNLSSSGIYISQARLQHLGNSLVLDHAAIYDQLIALQASSS